MFLTILDPRSGQKVTMSIADVAAVEQPGPAKVIPYPRFVTGLGSRMAFPIVQKA